MAAAGSSSFAWDGKDSAGKVVPDEAYLYLIEASDGTRSDSYSPGAPTGTGGVTCSKSAYNVYKNEPMTISYSVSQPERVDISISWGSQNFKIMNAVPCLSGNYTFDWDGRNSSGKILAEGAVSSCAVASLLRENAIVTSGDTVMVTNLKTDPYGMQLSYGQFTRLKYTLSRAAIVSINLISPSGTAIIVASNQAQSAGANELEWNAADATDPQGKSLLVSEEGDYIVSIQAANSSTGTITTKRGSLNIGY
jgi:flagellar hook assembly protein FlgD